MDRKSKHFFCTIHQVRFLTGHEQIIVNKNTSKDATRHNIFNSNNHRQIQIIPAVLGEVELDDTVEVSENLEDSVVFANYCQNCGSQVFQFGRLLFQ